MKCSGNVVYLDNHLLIAEKKAPLLTQPDGSSSESFQEEMMQFLKIKYQKPGNVFLHALHRLDKNVSGLVLFARTSKALIRLNEMMRLQAIERIYIAEVEGILEKEEGRLDHFLIHQEYRAVVAKEGSLEAKKARLYFKTLCKKEHSTVVQIVLETGRYHQIRAQFAAIGHPVRGDQKYGAQENKEAIFLFCHQIAFDHPVTKERVVASKSPWFFSGIK